MSTQGESMPRIRVAHDKMSAEIVIPADCSADGASAASLLSVAMDAGIEFGADVRRRIEEVAAAFVPGTESVCLVASGIPPVHGKDARIEWAPDEPEAESPNTFHLRRIGAVRVKAGSELGAVVPPTPAQDGRDVFGRTIAAREGKPPETELREGLQLDARGKITAQIDGLLVRTKQRALISTVLDIETQIDPATKVVAYEGPVIIRKAVTPGIALKIGGDLEVHGSIECADIDCRANMVAHGGMTSRSGICCIIRGNLTARYMSSVEGVIAGNLVVDREIVNSHLTIGGSLSGPGASLIGGQITVTGSIKLLQIGNESEHRTTLSLGEVPLSQRIAEEAKRVWEAATERVRTLEAEQLRLTAKGVILAATEKERLTELMFELSEAISTERAAGAKHARAEQEVRSRRTIDVRIERAMYPGVVLLVQQRRYEVIRLVRGPVNIRIDSHGQPVLVTASGESSLETVCRSSQAA